MTTRPVTKWQVVCSTAQCYWDIYDQLADLERCHRAQSAISKDEKITLAATFMNPDNNRYVLYLETNNTDIIQRLRETILITISEVPT